MATKFIAESIDDLIKFLRDQANKASAAGSGLARNKSDRRYYEGKQAAYNDLAYMLEHGELEILSVAKLVQRIQDSGAIDMPDRPFTEMPSRPITDAELNKLGDDLIYSQPSEDELVRKERAEQRHAKELEDAELELTSQDKATRTSELKGLFATYGCAMLWQPRFSSDSILRIIEQLPKSQPASTLRSVLRRHHTDVLRRLQGINGAGTQRPISSGFSNGVYDKNERKANAE